MRGARKRSGCRSAAHGAACPLAKMHQESLAADDVASCDRDKKAEMKRRVASGRLAVASAEVDFGDRTLVDIAAIHRSRGTTI